VVVHLGAGMPDVLEVAPGEGGVGFGEVGHPAMIGAAAVRLKHHRDPARKRMDETTA
jgi:hypothetical protein